MGLSTFAIDRDSQPLSEISTRRRNSDLLTQQAHKGNDDEGKANLPAGSGPSPIAYNTFITDEHQRHAVVKREARRGKKFRPPVIFCG